MTEYLVPSGPGECEYVEKRSRFIGHVFYVETETEARACIDAVRKKYYDARHNCWCYRLHMEGAERCSDDGEPQGTAGQPMLNVFQREGVENVCCVVTRYFGGILLGAGGLVRAYTQSAKEALDAAEISAVRRWKEVTVTCPYHLFERVRQEAEAGGGLVTETDYAESVTLHVLFPDEKVARFATQVAELTAGSVRPEETGECFRAASCAPKT